MKANRKKGMTMERRKEGERKREEERERDREKKRKEIGKKKEKKGPTVRGFRFECFSPFFRDNRLD